MSAEHPSNPEPQSGTGKSTSRRRARDAIAELSPEEKLEIELGEQARISADDWSGAVAPGKAARFGPSFRRLIGLLRPNAVGFIFVSILGSIGVVLAVLSPKVLGEATNILFEGVVSSMAPVGATK
jgi:ATP-binding cassette subfamily B protein